MARARSFLLLLFIIGACQPLPRPFSPSEGEGQKATLDVIPRSIVVLEVAAAPERVPERLAEAMAKALRDLEIPAMTSGGNQSSYFLQGRAETTPAGPARLQLVLAWDLVDGDGTLVGARAYREVVPRISWEVADSRFLDGIARRSAPEIAALIGETGSAASPPRAARPLHVWPVAGASSEGAAALKRALEAALRAAGLTVSDTPVDDGLIVLGSVSVAALSPRQDKVEINWTVITQDGTRLGNVRQSNAVPSGSLDRSWSAVAGVVAENAADGVAQLLARLPPQPTSAPTTR